MNQSLPQLYIVRHGETAWSITGQHTGRTDLPLTEQGERAARAIGTRLAGQSFDRVFSSPRIRAKRTCELAGYATKAVVDEDLAEWDYGDYEGLRTADIRKLNPHWELFRDGAPGGESVADITARTDRMIAKLRDRAGMTLVFSSGHISRVLAARWLAQDTDTGRWLLLGTASVSILGYDHTLTKPALYLWNDRRHIETLQATI